MDKISYDSGRWSATLLIQDDYGSKLKVYLSNEVYIVSCFYVLAINYLNAYSNFTYDNGSMPTRMGVLSPRDFFLITMMFELGRID